MKDFFCANCRKYKNIELKVMVKKANGVTQPRDEVRLLLPMF